LSTPYRISEIFRSLQGEGPSAGTPAHFVRMQGCTVGCHWCDTKYSWEAGDGRALTAAQAFAEARALGEAPLLVVTGGEPLEHRGLDELLREAVQHWPRVEVETSGIAPPPLSHPRLHWNVSPKLPAATARWAETWAHLPAWVAEANVTFKIVVGGPPDPDDVRRLLDQHRLPLERVMLMPEGLTDAALKERAVELAGLCQTLGVRMSPRLHIWLWGARRGV
jgi:organic radical activating enzyme